jgi:hypothetical protein
VVYSPCIMNKFLTIHRKGIRLLKFFKRISRTELILGAALLLAVALLRWPALVQPVTNDIGANAYGARLILQGEPLYGSYHPAHHLPAVYYTYALIFALLGDRPEALQLFLIPWIWLNAWILYAIGKQISTPLSGMLAAFFFVLIGSMTNLNGDTAELELFANLPVALGVFAGGWLIAKGRRAITFTLIGAIGAFCFLYKAVYLAPLAVTSAALLLQALLDGRRAAWAALFMRLLAMLAGCGAVLGLVGLYFAVLGLFPRLWLVFQLGSGYVEMQDSLPAIYILLTPAILLIVANLIFSLLGALGTLRALVQLPGLLKRSQPKGLALFMLVTWLLVSIVEAGASRFGFAHYALLVVPPLALLVGRETGELYRRIGPRPGFSGALRRAWLPGLMALAVIGNTVFTSQGYLGGFLSYVTGRISREEFVRKDTAIGVDNLNAVAIAGYIQAHTSADARIFGWTELAQIPYLANRRSTSDVLWPIYIDQLGSPRRVITAKPVYVVVGPPFKENTPEPDWLKNDLASGYRLETTIDQYQLYRLISG